MDALSILQTKRGGTRPHTRQELEWWISQYSLGTIPDYQMAAWLMAVCWRGMTANETAILTKCMVDSGARLDWSNGVDSPPSNLVDKHSTGGVGDKISLILAPLVATLGVHVPMMAGRGLGHTGGTIDKLESLPGYQTNLSIPDFQRIVKEVGCSIVSASTELCVADRKLYALRDVTATVSCIPLQTASILCKKIAERPNSLVLDVKYGRASFQATRQDAETLAQSMIATGEANGLTPTTCFLTHMDSVIGTSVGNWLELHESMVLLKTGQGSSDLIALVVVQAAQMLQQSELYQNKSWDDLIQLALDTLSSGKAYSIFERMVQAHGGDVSVCQDLSSCPHPPPKYIQDVRATQTGYISKLDGMVVGTVCVQLGAGRQVADQAVDPMAGLHFWVREGDHIQKGATIGRVQTNRSQDVLDRVCATLQADAIAYSETLVTVPFVISHRVTNQGAEDFVVPSCLLAPS
jgi:pyrimidine-nucleoside phosphorylase